MHALITERVPGNGVDRIDKPLPLWLIPSTSKCVCPGAGIKGSQLVVFVDVGLAHAEQPL